MFNEPRSVTPRASRIRATELDRLGVELWMGGADALHGELVQPENLHDAWLLDVAGDMPPAYRAACGHWLSRVFADMEQPPQAYHRLQQLASSIAACISGAVAESTWEHPAHPPRRVYVMCQQGMNRSGLLTGLILRALGVSIEDTLTAIATRPGALTNQTYVALLRGAGRRAAGQ